MGFTCLLFKFVVLILRMGFTVFFFFFRVVGFVLIFSFMVQQVLGFAFLGSDLGFRVLCFHVKV